MTFKEKWEQDHPGEEFKVLRAPGDEWNCPYKNGYEAAPNVDTHCMQPCMNCWNREMPGTAEKPHILDSGERRQFKTGAVRDIQEGKGMFDLVPLKVAARIFGAPYIQPEDGYVDPVLWCIGHYQDNGDTCWVYTALAFIAERVFPVGNDRQASIANMLLEVAIHFEEGARKYEPNNWKKGIPIERYIDSGTRHYTKWLRGDKDEPHNRAAAWNLICLAWEADFSPRAKEMANLITPIESAPADMVRYGDCPAGLFEYNNEGVFVKTAILDGNSARANTMIAVHVNSGATRCFDNDVLVRPIDSPFADARCGDE